MPSLREILRRHALQPCLAACLALLCITIGGAASVEEPLAAQRAEFLRAYSQPAAVSAGADSTSLQRYVLFPYVQAARLERALTAAAAAVPGSLDQQVAAFLREHESEPVARDLRRKWLSSLAARARWEDLLSFQKDSDDAGLRCLGFAARIELGRTTDLAPQVTQSWLIPRSVPECERAFSWLDSTGALTPALIEQRVRLALEAGNPGFARQIAARLPAARAAPLLQWADLLDHPQRSIDALISAPQTRVEAGALLAGWAKLARANRGAATQRFDRLVRLRQLDDRAASPLALALALPLSWDRDADALRYFARVQPADFDDNAREWQARAALWAGDWKQVSRSIEAMSATARGSARWRYWSARVAAHEGREAAARQLYEGLLKDDNYYSGMAAARLKRPAAPNPQVLPADAALLARLEATPAFVRARELRLNALADKARAEWSLGHSQLAPTVRPQMIHLASRWGWHEQAVATATGEQVFNDYALLYPRPYDAEVAVAAAVSGVDATLIYGVIRQESLYQRDALSSASAQGLMQLTTDTARRTARQWKQPAPTATSLFEPGVNVMLGAAHLKDLLDRFDDQLPLALAGYNAGPGAAQRWLPAESLDPDIWIENIPYNETRSYVQRIHWHMVVFHWLRNGEPTDTRSWLKDVRR